MNGGIRSALLVGALLAGGSVGCGGSSTRGAPVPTPGPTPFLPGGCRIVWISHDPPGQSRTVDYYILDAPVAAWFPGVGSYAPPGTPGAVTGAFVDDFDLVERTSRAAVVATGGEFVLDLPAADPLLPGASVGFLDEAPQEYFLLGSSGSATLSQGLSGTGSFEGIWSTPEDPEVSPGEGTLSIAYLGTGHVLGVDLTYALCYEDGAAEDLP